MFRLPFGFTLNPRGSSIESGYSKFLSNLLVSKLGKVSLDDVSLGIEAKGGKRGGKSRQGSNSLHRLVISQARKSFEQETKG